MSTSSAQLAADIAQLHTDAGLMHNVIHGDANTTVLTSGGTVRSVANAVNSITQFNPRGAWATATAYAFKDLFTNAGAVYVALVAHTSTTISADQTAGKIAIYQGSTSDQIVVDDTTLTGFLLNRNHRVVDSAAALRALSSAKYTRASTVGYWGAGKGGHGDYWQDPSNTTSGAYFTGSIAPIAAPVAPVLSSSVAGSLPATTDYVKVTYVTAAGETAPSAESSLAVAANSVLVVQSPAAQAGATGYNVYMSTGPGTETKQNSAPIAIGTNWTEPPTGLVAGAAMPAGSTAGSLLTVSAITNGVLAVNQQVNGAGSVAASYIAARVTGLGGVGTYLLNVSQTVAGQVLVADDAASYFVGFDGARWTLLHHGLITVNQAGAKGDGSDDTYPIRAAVATGLRVRFPIPSLYYYVKDAITCATKGQIIEGDGRQISIIKIDSAFNMSALGVFVASSGEEGPHFRSLKITFVQPDTAVRANLTNYPPALYMRGTPRFTVENMAITQAMVGIDLAGGANSGGAFIERLEMSAYSIGINIDGALDSVRINKLHFWNFDLTTNQASVFNDGNTIGVQTARCDDFHLSDSLFINNGAQLKLTSSASGTTFGEVINTDFDTYGGLVMSAGNLSVSGCFMSVGFAGNQAIYQTGGFLKVANSEIEAAVATTNPLIQLAGPGTLTSGYMEIAGGMIRLSGDQQAVSVSASSGTNALVMTGVQLQLPQNTSPTNPVIAVAAGGRATITSCRASDKGTGTGNLITVASDDDHIISDNALMGWALALPAVMTLSVVSNNSGPPGADFVGNYLVGSFKIKRFTGMLDASGNLTVAHGIANAHQKGLIAQAWYRGASGEMRAMTFGAVDGTNFTASGGTASVAFRAVIFWAETTQSW